MHEHTLEKDHNSSAMKMSSRIDSILLITSTNKIMYVQTVPYTVHTIKKRVHRIKKDAT